MVIFRGRIASEGVRACLNCGSCTPSEYCLHRVMVYNYWREAPHLQVISELKRALLVGLPSLSARTSRDVPFRRSTQPEETWPVPRSSHCLSSLRVQTLTLRRVSVILASSCKRPPTFLPLDLGFHTVSGPPGDVTARTRAVHLLARLYSRKRHRWTFPTLVPLLEERYCSGTSCPSSLLTFDGKARHKVTPLWQPTNSLMYSADNIVRIEMFNKNKDSLTMENPNTQLG